MAKLWVIDEINKRLIQTKFISLFPLLDKIFETTSNRYKQTFSINVGSRLYEVNYASAQKIGCLANDCLPIYIIKDIIHVHLSHSISKYKKALFKMLDEYIKLK